MTATTIRTELLRAVDAAKDAVEKNPRPETYRALLEAQSELQRHDLDYGRSAPARQSSPQHERRLPARAGDSYQRSRAKA
jgi:hypothetical protein